VALYLPNATPNDVLCDTNWGVGVVLIPKNPWEAEELEKGYILGKMEDKDYNKSGIDDLFFLEHFVLCKKAQIS
jgi:hypothetical protein